MSGQVYQVLEATRDTITLWDGVTKLDKHPDKPGGLMVMHVYEHGYAVGDRVQLTIRKVASEEGS